MLIICIIVTECASRMHHEVVDVACTHVGLSNVHHQYQPSQACTTNIKLLKRAHCVSLTHCAWILAICPRDHVLWVERACALLKNLLTRINRARLSHLLTSHHIRLNLPNCLKRRVAISSCMVLPACAAPWSFTSITPDILATAQATPG